MDIFLGQLGHVPFVTERHDFSWQRNRAGHMLQGLGICPQYQIFLVTNSMQMLLVMIRRTLVGLKAET
jgi:hypothetical protein